MADERPVDTLPPAFPSRDKPNRLNCTMHNRPQNAAGLSPHRSPFLPSLPHTTYGTAGRLNWNSNSKPDRRQRPQRWLPLSPPLILPARLCDGQSEHCLIDSTLVGLRRIDHVILTRPKHTHVNRFRPGFHPSLYKHTRVSSTPNGKGDEMK